MSEILSKMYIGPHVKYPLFLSDCNESLIIPTYEGWNFNSGNYLFTTDTK